MCWLDVVWESMSPAPRSDSTRPAWRSDQNRVRILHKDDRRRCVTTQRTVHGNPILTEPLIGNRIGDRHHWHHRLHRSISMTRGSHRKFCNPKLLPCCTWARRGIRLPISETPVVSNRCESNVHLTPQDFCGDHVLRNRRDEIGWQVDHAPSSRLGAHRRRLWFHVRKIFEGQSGDCWLGRSRVDGRFGCSTPRRRDDECDAIHESHRPRNTRPIRTQPTRAARCRPAGARTTRRTGGTRTHPRIAHVDAVVVDDTRCRRRALGEK